jgi:CRP-like cAMP-binding protein
MQQLAAAGAVRPVGQRLQALGIASTQDLDALFELVKVRDGIGRGETVIGTMQPVTHFTLLLEGVACSFTRHEDGGRQIHAFHYPGDFLALHSFLFPRSTELIEVQALTKCSAGTIDNNTLDQAVQRHPTLGQALWRAAMFEAGVSRQRLVTMRWPALQRVAHLLCEQLARLGIANGSIPLSQIEIADAAGLSVVHTNRIFQDLRKLGALSEGRLVEVADRERLHKLAAFDGRYLDVGESLSRWSVRIEN